MSKVHVAWLVSVAAVFLFFPVSAFPQGPLDPGSPPGETMKTLDEIYTQAETAAREAAVSDDPRTPITNLPYTISAAGAYYLTGNLVGTFAGITINADHVVLDLNGFTMTGDTTGDGITAGAYKSIEIRNGTVQYWNYGLSLSAATQVRLLNLNVLTNNNHGILLGDDAQVQDCRARGNAFSGIFAGQRCTISDSVVSENSAVGIDASYNASVTGCRVENNQGGGIGVSVGGLVQNCIAMNNGLGGSGANIAAGGVPFGNCRIIGNQIRTGPTGLQLTGSGSYVADNYVQGCTDNYNFSDGNQLNLLLCEVPESLDWPCSVKFAGTLTCTSTTTNGITVTARDVTIDLDGHTLIGPGPVGNFSGIVQYYGRFNLTIRNGRIVDWRGGNARGIYIMGSSPSISDIHAFSNRVGILCDRAALIRNCHASYNLGYGIYAPLGSRIESCTASYNGHYGIYGHGVISHCAALHNATDGIVAEVGGTVVVDCHARNNGECGILSGENNTISRCTATGNDTNIWSISQTVVENCTVSGARSTGIKAGHESTVRDCAVTDNADHGIEAESDCLVIGNNCTGNGGSGIHITAAGNRVERNTCILNNEGISVSGADNLIIANSCRFNPDASGTGNFNIAGGNNYGQIVTSPGADFTMSNPWANFDF